MNISTDYLIVGSGAMGMAFADVLVEETDFTLTLVDKNESPGGHWNHAYPFVRLHQPAAFYGVSSRELSNGKKDTQGVNKGFYSLSSLDEIQTYFKAVMEEQFLPSGRVHYFPNSTYLGEGQIRNDKTGEITQVDIKKKTVDARHLNTSVPATHQPNFTLDKGVVFAPLNHLPEALDHPHYCIIGGGKTGMDAINYLLEQGIAADNISWVISRDGWLIDRATAQNAPEFFHTSIGNQANQFEALAQSTSLEDLFQRLEDKGVLMRLSKAHKPRMFHGATVSKAELKQLQAIKHSIRKGKVTHIAENKMTLEQGTEIFPDNTFFVDCSATPISKELENVPIFQGDKIITQTVRSYQPAFSAAFIAHVEVAYTSEKEKNKLCGVVPLPDKDTDWLTGLAASMTNQFNWSGDKELRKWTLKNRLDGFSALVRNVDASETDKMAILNRLKSNMLPAMMKLQQYLEEINQGEKRSLRHPQFQVNKKLFFQGQLAEQEESNFDLKEGEILVKIDQFAYTANNITYAATGDLIRYWEFFPAANDPENQLGVIPVWGFAEVTASKTEGIPVGDRLYGYFPPASQLKLSPTRINDLRFFDGSEHRKTLPMGYNLYRRVLQEPGYNPAFDRERALLFPLYLTSYCIWDSLQSKQWHDAEQVIVLSASSKTSLGLGYALKEDKKAPKSIGLTSAKNKETVKALDVWDEVLSYDEIDHLDSDCLSLVVDMSGNNSLLQALEATFKSKLTFILNVGLTHWGKANPKDNSLAHKSKFFFAPGHIEKRYKDWGPEVFEQKTQAFLFNTSKATRAWLEFNEIEGLEALAKLHGEVCAGTRPPREGIIVKM